MSGWFWKQAVAERALEVVNASGTARFTIQDVYDRQDVLQQRFPNNENVPRENPADPSTIARREVPGFFSATESTRST